MRLQEMPPLEPEVVHGYERNLFRESDNILALFSIAISLKRIADMLERIPIVKKEHWEN